MKHDVPAPGFTRISGTRPPPSDWEKVWVQLRNGWADHHGPWPVNGPRWVHDGTAGDIVAVRKA